MTPDRSSARSWMLPLALLIVLLAMLRLQPAVDHANSPENPERQKTAALQPRPIDNAPLDAFDSWLAKGLHAHSLKQGVEVARVRRVAMNQLIQFGGPH